MTPRKGRPSAVASATRRSATPGDAMSPVTTRTSQASGRAADGGRRLDSTTLVAPRSASHRAATRPNPPKPPVTTYAPARTTGAPPARVGAGDTGTTLRTNRTPD